MQRRISLALLIIVLASPLAARAAEPLSTWNEGPAKQAILEFVAKVTTEGGPDFVPPDERIATFDNDGTLWCEQPMYDQLVFAIDRVKQLAPEHPEWKTKEPFSSFISGDLKKAMSTGEKAVEELLAVTHAGMTTDQYAVLVRDWLATARHPRFKRPYNECIYQPMVELLDYLRANGFKTFIVSGGGIEFMRVWAEQAYGIPPEQIVGSSGKLKYEVRDGVPVIMKLPAVDFIDDGPGKPVGIQENIGRRPILAFGNSDGDFQMLQWTTAGDGARLGLIVHHTDAEREYAYDRHSTVGKLDKALDAAAANKWVIVDMKTDWAVVFPSP